MGPQDTPHPPGGAELLKGALVQSPCQHVQSDSSLESLTWPSRYASSSLCRPCVAYSPLCMSRQNLPDHHETVLPFPPLFNQRGGASPLPFGSGAICTCIQSLFRARVIEVAVQMMGHCSAIDMLHTKPPLHRGDVQRPELNAGSVWN